MANLLLPAGSHFAGGDGWRQLGKSGSADMETASFLPGDAVVLLRRDSAAISASFTGTVRSNGAIEGLSRLQSS